MSRISTQSYVQVMIQIPTGVYGKECTMAQIIDQASREGRNAALALVNGKGKVIGEPKVVTVTTESENGLFGIFGS